MCDWLSSIAFIIATIEHLGMKNEPTACYFMGNSIILYLVAWKGE